MSIDDISKTLEMAKRNCQKVTETSTIYDLIGVLEDILVYLELNK